MEVEVDARLNRFRRNICKCCFFFRRETFFRSIFRDPRIPADDDDYARWICINLIVFFVFIFIGKTLFFPCVLLRLLIATLTRSESRRVTHSRDHHTGFAPLDYPQPSSAANNCLPGHLFSSVLKVFSLCLNRFEIFSIASIDEKHSKVYERKRTFWCE